MEPFPAKPAAQQRAGCDQPVSRERGEIRNPKAEARKKAEIRSPKTWDLALATRPLQEVRQGLHAEEYQRPPHR